MDLITRFTTAWNSFYQTWMGLDRPPSYFNPVFFSLTTQEEERVKKYQKLQSYYDGEHTQYLDTAFGRPNDNVILNYSKRIVNKSIDYLFAKPLTLDITEYQDTALEELLDQIFISEERQQELLLDMGLSGSILGDFYLQMVIGEDGIVRPINLNPLSVFPTFNPQNYHEVMSYDIRWLESDTVWRIKHYPDNENWMVEYQYQDKGLDAWITDESRSYVWEWDFPMIIKGKNLPKANSPWGMSDLEDADINDYINLASSNMNKIIRLFAHPILWGRKFNLKEADLSRIQISDDEKAHLAALELTRDLDSSAEFISSLKTAYHEINNIPESDPEKMKIGAQSGFSLNVLNNDLMLKTTKKRSLYGSVIKEFCTKAFFMMGYPEVIVKLNWQNPLPIDIREETEGHRFDLEAGLTSKKTLASQRGYDFEEEQRRIEEERSFSSSIGEALLTQFETRGIPVSQG